MDHRHFSFQSSALEKADADSELGGVGGNVFEGNWCGRSLFYFISRVRGEIGTGGSTKSGALTQQNNRCG
jgi:hypothetical protein